MFVFYNSMLFVFFVGSSDAFYCWECSSKRGNCSQDSLQGAISSHCGREYNFCATYKTTASDGSSAVFTRACAVSCSTPFSSWETKIQNSKVKHCLVCCNSGYRCNDILGDPCNSTSQVQNSFLMISCILSLLWSLLCTW